MSGVSSSSTRTRGSNATNEDSVGVRSYCGGESDRTALNTVVLEIPNLAAMRAFGTPSAANLRINAQSSKVITLQSSSVHFSPPKLTSFRAPSTALIAVQGVVFHVDNAPCDAMSWSRTTPRANHHPGSPATSVPNN